MAKNDVKEIVNEAEEVVNDVTEETSELHEKAVKAGSKVGNYVGSHWKGWVKRALWFGLGVAFKTGLDYVMGGDFDVVPDGTDVDVTNI